MPFDDFENKYLKLSEYVIMVTSGKYADSLDIIYPRLLVFLTVRPTWRNRMIVIYIGPPERQEIFEPEIFTNPAIIFSPNQDEWDSQTNEWDQLLGVLKKDVLMTSTEASPILQHTTNQVNALNSECALTNLNTNALTNQNTPNYSTVTLWNESDSSVKSETTVEKQALLGSSINELNSNVLAVGSHCSQKVERTISDNLLSCLPEEEKEVISESELRVNDNYQPLIGKFKTQLVQTDQDINVPLCWQHLSDQSIGLRLARRHSLDNMCLCYNSIKSKFQKRSDISPDGFGKFDSQSLVIRNSCHSIEQPQHQNSSENDEQFINETKSKKSMAKFFKSLRIKQKRKKDRDANFKLRSTINELATFSTILVDPKKNRTVHMEDCIQSADTHPLKTVCCQAEMKYQVPIEQSLHIQTYLSEERSKNSTSSIFKQRNDSGIMSNYSFTSTDAFPSPSQIQRTSYFPSADTQRRVISFSAPSSLVSSDIDSEWSSIAESPEICQNRSNNLQFERLPINQYLFGNMHENLEELHDESANKKSISPENVVNEDLNFAAMKIIDEDFILAEHKKIKQQKSGVKAESSPCVYPISLQTKLCDSVKTEVIENTKKMSPDNILQTASSLNYELDSQKTLSEDDVESISTASKKSVKPIIMNPDSHAYSESFEEQTLGDVSDNELPSDFWTDSESMGPSQNVFQMADFDMDLNTEVLGITKNTVYATNQQLDESKSKYINDDRDTGFETSGTWSDGIKPSLLIMENTEPELQNDGYESFPRSSIVAKTFENVEDLQPLRKLYEVDSKAYRTISNAPQIEQVRGEPIDVILAKVNKITKSEFDEDQRQFTISPDDRKSEAEKNIHIEIQRNMDNGQYFLEGKHAYPTPKYPEGENFIFANTILFLENAELSQDIRASKEPKEQQQNIEGQEYGGQYLSLLDAGKPKTDAKPKEVENITLHPPNLSNETLNYKELNSGYTETNIDDWEHILIEPKSLITQNVNTGAINYTPSISRSEGLLLMSLAPASPETMRLVKNASRSYEMYHNHPDVYQYKNIDEAGSDYNDWWNPDGHLLHQSNSKRPDFLSFLPSSAEIPKISVSILNMMTGYLPRYISAMHNWSESTETLSVIRNPDERLELLARNAQEFILKHPVFLLCTTLAAPMLQQIPHTLMDLCCSGVIQGSFHLATNQPRLFLSERFSDFVSIFRATPNWYTFSLAGRQGGPWHLIRPS